MPLLFTMITRCNSSNSRKYNCKNLLSPFSVVLFLVFCLLLVTNLPLGKEALVNSTRKNVIRMVEKVVILSNSTTALERNNICSYYNCFNVYKCGKNGQQQIQVYVYPLKQYVTEQNIPIVRQLTREYHSIIQTVLHSKYHTSNPKEACIFIVPFDTLAQDNFLAQEMAQALNSLSYWNDGENHVIFNMLPDKHTTVLELSTGKAIIAGAGFDSWTYRPGFDISLPVYTPYCTLDRSNNERIWFVVSAQLNIHSIFINKMKNLQKNRTELIIMRDCSNSNLLYRCFNGTRYNYPQILKRSVFCIILRGTRLTQPILIEAMAAGCIPMVFADTLVMPFHEIIDWKRAAIFIPEDELETMIDVAKSVSSSRIKEMSHHCVWLFTKYFNSIEAIVNTTLEIFNQRVFPENAIFYEDWNLRSNLAGARSPLFLKTKSYSQSFTAVVLSYERPESLFSVIKKLASVPSLSMILVIWNNQNSPPPELSAFPEINKPIKIKRTKANKLSNRFYPYEEIETEAVLSLDDDISMLTEDELDFGFEVWREFPDRIVGFPSRTHVWNNVTQSWRYESEWTNEISMILTGAAFYHKYWNYLYTTTMPKQIKDWVDKHMNCEDIAMNFLVANMTNKAPIKVAPRKKFKCPECTNTEMLSADLHHMVERSRCINKFTEIYGRMPLKKVEFRADPVLYKDSFPAKLKRFKNIGNL